MMTFRLRLKRIIKPTNTRIKYDQGKLKAPTVAKYFQAKIGGKIAPLILLDNENNDIYTTIGEPSSKCDEFLAARSQFESDMSSICLRLYLANPPPLCDRFLRFIVLCFFTKKGCGISSQTRRKNMRHFVTDAALIMLRD